MFAQGFGRMLQASMCFSLLPRDWMESIQVVAGDLRLHKCGLDTATYDRIAVEITHIIHCAGSVKFDSPIAEAAAANITSSLNVMELAQKSPNIQHVVSTARSCVNNHCAAEHHFRKLATSLPWLD
jgi:thioester reductase-like protein